MSPDARVYDVMVTAVQDMEIARYLSEHRGEQPEEPTPKIKWWIPVLTADADADGVGLKRAMKEYELRLVAHALRQGRTIQGAARLLQVPRTTLVDRLRRLGLHRRGA